jgi:phospholipid/cholesterol/gamma-HCH transport system substrate-binding protein
METRANYVAVGAFVLAVLAGIFVATLWLARIQFETQYKYYQTYLAGPVTGLGRGSLVRLNGIEVGRVTGIDLDPRDPQLVALVLQVRDTVQIHTDAMLSLETQGLTGVSYIEIAGGTLSSPPLVAVEGQRYPVIASRPSSLQEVFNNAPQLVNRLLVIADRLGALLDENNRQAGAETLTNLRDTTAVFSHRATDIDQLITDGGAALHDLAASTASLHEILGKINRSTDKADLVVAAYDAANQVTKAAADLDAMIVSSKPGVRDLTTNGSAQLNELLAEARRLVASLSRVSTQLERDPSRFLFGDHREGYKPK